ncbi:hypothetical protein DAMA08_021150 (mitochondrion) [Martiniozyma asiatica (nom. inval.)]|nr:hypothetical protein DAMA08_021150 [Martiniozyma asiatica]
MNLNKNMTKLMNNRLSDEYIAGFVHGDGSFSVNLNFRTNKKNKKIYLQPMFMLTQHNRNYDLMENMIKRLKNVGHYRIDNNNIIRYRVTDLDDMVNVMMPFFEKNKLMYDNKSKNLSLVLNYGMISDVLNSELMYDLKDYFNVGSVYKRKGENTYRYFVNKTDMLLTMMPKIYNVNNYHEMLINNENMNKGPIMKNEKIISMVKMLDTFEEYKMINKNNNEKMVKNPHGLDILNQMLYLSYEIRDMNLKNKESFDSYLMRMNKKLNKI